MKEIIQQLRQELINKSDEKTRISSMHFFKEIINCYGIKSADVGDIAKNSFSRVKDLPKKEIFDLCENLWQSGMLEETFIACHWSYSLHKKFEPEDFERFRNWVLKYVDNWASCDTFCNHTLGTLVEMYPQFIGDLKQMAHHENRWMRRAAAVTLIIPARNGLFLNDIFEIADILLMDKDDMVQKGYGWMLKVAANKHLQEVYDYVISKKSVMPRTSLRYAIEKMPQEMKKKAMEKNQVFISKK